MLQKAALRSMTEGPTSLTYARNSEGSMGAADLGQPLCSMPEDPTSLTYARNPEGFDVLQISGSPELNV